MKADLHPREQERLRALRDYGVLDTEPEAEFDDMARLAATICDTPVAMVSLVDENRQWFKAEVGLGFRETALETSICGHVVLAETYVEIPDTRIDRRSSDIPFCISDPGLRFYAGMPLMTAQGLPLGTLCVMDYRVRKLTEQQREALRVLARQVVAQLDLKKALRNADLLRQEVDHRVKNSLQSVAALARLQARAAQGEDVRDALDKVAQRIDTVSALHEQLYRTNAADRIDLGDYLANVARYLEGVRPGAVRLEVAAEPFAVSSARAAAVAVIVNEFVQNAFVHAFPDGRAGSVSVTGAAAAGGYRIELADDGVGFALDHMRPGGLGLRLIEASADQLGGTYRRLAAQGGTRAELVFATD